MSSDQQRFLVRFWGVRGSYPTPGPHTLRHGGNTSCVEVQVGQRVLIFDAGSGIIGLGNALMRRAHSSADLDLSLYITHGHGDHLQGFPFFSPLFDPRTTLHLFGPQLADRDIEQLITPFMAPPYFPVDIHTLPSQHFFHTITDQRCITWQPGREEPLLQTSFARSKKRDPETVTVLAMLTQSHPLDGAIFYRVEYGGRAVVYATDVEWGNGCESEFLDFVRDADVLIHDAQYTTHDYQHEKHGYGHCTVDMAVKAAQAAHVRELILFHHEPTYTDDQLDAMEIEAQASFVRTRSACEGMEIDLLNEKVF